MRSSQRQVYSNLWNYHHERVEEQDPWINRQRCLDGCSQYSYWMRPPGMFVHLSILGIISSASSDETMSTRHNLFARFNE